jgi:Tfp pilus assembly protein PilF
MQNNYAAIFYQRAKITTDTVEKRRLFIKSIQLLEGVTRQYPDYIEAYIQKGISYLEIKDCDNAVKNFEKAKSISKYNFLIQSNLGIGYINCGKSEQALDIFRELLKKDKSLTSFYMLHLGVAHINTNSLDSADYYFNRIKQDYPDDTEVDPYIKILAEKMKLKLAQSKSQPQAPPQALATTPPQVFDANTNKRFNDGYQAYQKGDKVKAKSMLENLIKTTPTHALGYAVLGIIAFDNNEVQKSIDYYKKSIALNPTDGRIYFNLGNSYLKLNKDAEAIKIFEKCIQQAPTYDKPYIALENYYTSKNNPEKAAYYAAKLKNRK